VNFLAHLSLGFKHPDWTYGQFIADAVKGSRHEELPIDIRTGVLAHRYVDYHTDTHPATLRLREKLRVKFGLMTPIVIDVLFDHALAVQWNEYHTTQLDEEIDFYHELLANHPHPMPANAKRLAEYMIGQEWLRRYSSYEGLDITFHQMSKRFPNGPQLTQVMREFPAFEKDLHDTFASVYPEIREGCEKIIPTFGLTSRRI
jgi:acyl carrier protein phosphodiesterase